MIDMSAPIRVTAAFLTFFGNFRLVGEAFFLDILWLQETKRGKTAEKSVIIFQLFMF